MQTRRLKKFPCALLLVLLLPFAVYPQRDPPVERLELKSGLLGRAIDYRVLYPVNYHRADNAEKRFPVLYLLHGFSGHNSNWIEKSGIALYATHYDLFVVFVEGDDGWYTTWTTQVAYRTCADTVITEVAERFCVQRQRYDGHGMRLEQFHDATLSKEATVRRMGT